MIIWWFLSRQKHFTGRINGIGANNNPGIGFSQMIFEVLTSSKTNDVTQVSVLAERVKLANLGRMIEN